jgi:hypothetical protein
MRIRIAVVAALAAFGLVAAVPAQAAGVCVDAYAELNGDVLVDETHCVEA